MKPGTERRRVQKRRAAGYIFFLGASMAILVIGISALTASRIEWRSARGTQDMMKSRIYARAGVERAFWEIRTNPSWRTDRGLGTWYAAKLVGEGVYSVTVTDLGGGVSDNTDADPFIIFTIGRSADAEHRMSVQVRPENGGYTIEPGSWTQVVN